LYGLICLDSALVTSGIKRDEVTITKSKTNWWGGVISPLSAPGGWLLVGSIGYHWYLFYYDVQTIQQRDYLGIRKTGLFEGVGLGVDGIVLGALKIRPGKVRFHEPSLFKIGVLEVPAGKVRFRKIGVDNFTTGHLELGDLHKAEVGVIELAILERNFPEHLRFCPVYTDGLAILKGHAIEAAVHGNYCAKNAIIKFASGKPYPGKSGTDKAAAFKEAFFKSYRTDGFIGELKACKGPLVIVLLGKGFSFRNVHN
jgi:hypothetical protein